MAMGYTMWLLLTGLESTITKRHDHASLFMRWLLHLSRKYAAFLSCYNSLTLVFYHTEFLWNAARITRWSIQFNKKKTRMYNTKVASISYGKSLKSKHGSPHPWNRHTRLLDTGNDERFRVAKNRTHWNKKNVCVVPFANDLLAPGRRSQRRPASTH